MIDNGNGMHSQELPLVSCRPNLGTSGLVHSAYDSALEILRKASYLFSTWTFLRFDVCDDDDFVRYRDAHA